MAWGSRGMGIPVAPAAGAGGGWGGAPAAVVQQLAGPAAGAVSPQAAAQAGFRAAAQQIAAQGGQVQPLGQGVSQLAHAGGLGGPGAENIGMARFMPQFQAPPMLMRAMLLNRLAGRGMPVGRIAALRRRRFGQ